MFSRCLLLSTLAFSLSTSALSAPQAVYVLPDGTIVNTTDFKFKAHKIQICDAAGANCTAIDTDLDSKQPLDSDLTAIAGISTTVFGRNALTIVDAPSFRSYIGAVIGTNVQAWDADLDTYAATPPSANAQTLLGHTFSQMRSDLSLVIGTNVEAWDADLDTYAANTPTTTGLNLVKLANPGAVTFIKIAADNSVSAESAATHRTSLGLAIGTNVQAWDADLDTYAATPPSANAQTLLGHTFSQMRSDLSLVIGTNVEAWDADLDTYAANPPTTTGLNLVKLTNPGAITFIKIAADNSVSAESAATHRTSLGLAIGTNVQAWDADLDAIAALAGTSGFLKKTGANTWSLDTNTYLTGNQSISITGDASGTGATAITLALSNIPTGTTMAGSLLATAIVAPSTPAAGKGSIYVDSTSKNIAVKDDAGVVKHGVQTKTAVANNFVTAVNDAGQVTVAQPAFTDLSGSVAASQMPGLTGDVTTSAGSVATTIATNVVTNAKAAQMAANTVKGNNTGSTANAADLTVSQAQTLLQINSSNKQTTTLGSAAATISFTVPSGYKNLRITFSGRGDDAAAFQSLRLRLATGGGAVDTGANYDVERLQENASTASGNSNAAQTFAIIGNVTTAGSTASYSASSAIDIPNYAGTTFYKPWMARTAQRFGTGSGDSSIVISMGHWKNTGAITSIELSPAAGNFITGTTATLIAE